MKKLAKMLFQLWEAAGDRLGAFFGDLDLVLLVWTLILAEFVFVLFFFYSHLATLPPYSSLKNLYYGIMGVCYNFCIILIADTDFFGPDD